MRIHTKLFITGFCLFLIFGLKAQNPFNEKGKAIDTKAIHLGKTSPVRDLIPMGPIAKEKKSQWKKENKVPRNFVGRSQNKVVHPDLEHQGVDKLRQGILAGSKTTTPNLLVNVDGITNSSPNDPSGDIGKDYYVLAINVTEIAVYDKAGAQITTFAANTLWQEIGFSSAGDPIVLYDQIADRWLITEFPSGNQLLVAISENSDPLGSYDVYNFQTPNFPDYPKYAIWDDVITVTTNEQGAGNLTTYYINKTELYKGNETVSIQRLNLPGNSNTEWGFFVATPVDWMGQTPPKSSNPIFLNLEDSSWGAVDEDQIVISTVEIDWQNPDNTTVVTQSVETSPFDSNPCSVFGFGFSCMPQAGNGGGLDGIPETIMNQAVYRNFNTHESMVFNFITDVTDGDNLSGIRWMELRREDADWYIYQEGTFSPDDGLDRYMGGTAIDGAGNIGLAYNVSSEDEFVGVRYTGRKHDDPLGEMTIAEQILVEGENTIQSGARFGDYAQMGVDPINDRTFWYVTEYGKGSGSSSSTRIAAFEIERDSFDIGAYKFNGALTGGFMEDEVISFQVQNFGTEAINSFTAGYIFENGAPVSQQFDIELKGGESTIVFFDETVDFIGAGTYSLTGFTQLESDQVIVNDSFRVDLTSIAALDAGIVGVSLESPTLCDSIAPLTVTLSNFGGDTLTSADIEILLNGTSIYNEPWEGSLAFCEQEIFQIDISGFISGENEIIASVSNPNGGTDQGLQNNESTTSLQFISNAVTLSINFDFDAYPEETTYEILDENNNVVASGGPFSGNIATEQFCADPDACYTFVIFDSFGDGIFFPGGYEIVDESGNVLASILNNDFGTEEQNEFCATFMCMLEVDIDITPALENEGGTILITPQNGVGPFSYSIDGGNTFQDSPLFENVPVGSYAIVVLGGEDCAFEGEALVEECSLSVVIEKEDETEGIPGSIFIQVTNGNPPYQYSIDGGENFSNNPLFTGLEEGDYEIVVRDADGCEFTTVITIDFVVATDTEKKGYRISATPNPTNGIFSIFIEGDIPGGERLGYVIYNAAGKIIRTDDLVRYGDTFVSQVSLYHEASGNYYIRFNSDEINELLRVIKI